jgi:hypothetical protein
MAISESHDCAVIVPARWETDPLLAWRCVNSKHAVFNAFLIFVHESQNLAGLLSSMLFHLPRNGVALGSSGPRCSSSACFETVGCHRPTRLTCPPDSDRYQ